MNGQKTQKAQTVSCSKAFFSPFGQSLEFHHWSFFLEAKRLTLLNILGPRERKYSKPMPIVRFLLSLAFLSYV